MPGVEIIQLVVMFILIQHKAVPLQNVLSCTLLSHLRVCASARSHMALCNESDKSDQDTNNLHACGMEGRV